MIIGISGKRDGGGSAGAGKDAVADVLVHECGFVRIALADAVKRVAQTIFGFTDDQLWGPSTLRDAPDPRLPREHGPWLPLPAPARHRMQACACCSVQRSAMAMSMSNCWSVHEQGASAGQPVAAACYLTPRFALQTIGTEIGRTLREDTWVDLAVDAAEKMLAGTHRYEPQRGVMDLKNHPYSKAQIDTCSWWATIPRGRPQGVVISDVRWPTGNEGRRIREAGGRLWRVDRPGAAVTGTSHASESQPAPDDAFDEVIRNDGSLDDLRECVLAAYSK